MIDVLFNESFSSTLKYYYQQHHIDQEVLSMPMYLGLGDINQWSFTEARKTLYKIMSTHSKTIDPNEYGEHLNAMTSRLKQAISNRETIRVWWSDLADDYCGFLWLCDYLSEHQLQMFSIHVPLSYAIQGNRLITLDSIGEITEDQLATLNLFKTEKVISAEKQLAYSYEWRELRSDNTPVRAMINGHMLSQKIDFYDQFLLGNVKKHRFRNIIRVIGDTIGSSPIGVADWWYCHRIDYLISKGVLDYKMPTNMAVGSIKLNKVNQTTF